MVDLSKTYYANGKLLLTGEYLVLIGAKALAFPLKLGQKLTVSLSGTPGKIKWKALYENQCWFSCVLNADDFSVVESTDESLARRLSNIFQVIMQMNPDMLFSEGLKFESELDFAPSWGLGSSSTLVSLLAQWSGVDPFLLNEKTFGGSGYDVACATAKGPIFYCKNYFLTNVVVDYPFSGNLYFVYSGKKKNSGEDVRHFMDQLVIAKQVIKEISSLSEAIAVVKEQDEFDRLLNIHENTIAELIDRVPVRKGQFDDFNGEIKSLGAWGGDFLLVSARSNGPEVISYFQKKGLDVIFRWDELVLKGDENG